METARLIMRNWQDEDFSAFYRLNNDPKVMEFFPMRLNEQQAIEKFNLERFPKSVKRFSNKKRRVNKKFERRSDPIRSKCALIRENNDKSDFLI